MKGGFYGLTVYKKKAASYSLINMEANFLGYTKMGTTLSYDPDVSRIYLIDRHDERVMRLYSKGERVA